VSEVFWLIFFGVTVLCAIACGFLAPTKGRPRQLWFVAGLVFGVLALAALAIVEPERPGDPAKGPICAHCGRNVEPTRKRLCNHCGEAFAA